MHDKVNLRDKLSTFDDSWAPRIVAELNQQLVKVAKFDGEYVWHAHADEDELFLVLDGEIKIVLRDREIRLGPGELFVVPRGVEHLPVAERPAQVLLIEPATTRSTGTVDHAYTIEPDAVERI